MVAQIDAKAATIWTAEIADEEKRNTVQQSVLSKWIAEDEAAAKAWAKEQGVEVP